MLLVLKQRNIFGKVVVKIKIHFDIESGGISGEKWRTYKNRKDSIQRYLDVVGKIKGLAY